MHDDERSTELATRSPELQALLRDLDALRLSLATDLTLAAAAVEAGSPELAGAVIDSDRAQLDAFAQRALRHLAGTAGTDTGAEVQAGAASPPVAPARRRRRRSLLTTVTPLLATAAAALSVFAGLQPTSGPDRADAAGTAMASYQELAQLTLEGAEAAEVERATQRLHDELAAIMAGASTDPAAAQEALARLESEARVLDGSADRDKLSGVIAEVRELVARLRAALPVSTPGRLPRVPAPTSGPGDVVVPAQPPAVPTLPSPPPPRPEPSPEPEGSPSAAPSPSVSPSESRDPDREDDKDDGVLPHAVLPD